MKDRFGGIERLYGEGGLIKLQSSHVAIVGVGGVGCWATEMLARAGIGKLTLIDADELCVTNINRQIHAMDSTIGQPKVEVMAQRILDINSSCQVDLQQRFFIDSTRDELLSSCYDVVIDAIDSVKYKVLLLTECLKREIAIVTVGGAGGKTDPAKIQVADLAQSRGDRLLKKVRYELRKHDVLRHKNKFKIPAVFSDQAMVHPFCDVDQLQSRKLDCNTGYGTSPTVISAFGIRAADLALKMLLNSHS